MSNEVNSSAGPPLAPRGRFQYSLSTLMLLTTIVALLCALGVSYREVRHARADRQAAVEEVKKYRGEMGYLEITDPERIYARALPGWPGDYHWSWRVYLPRKGDYALWTCTDQVPEAGFPNSWEGGAQIPPGEHVVDVAVNVLPNGKWQLDYSIRGGAAGGCGMPPLDHGWNADMVSDQFQETRDRDKRMVLLRLRNRPAASGGHSDPPPSTPTGGLMIWVGGRH